MLKKEKASEEKKINLGYFNFLICNTNKMSCGVNRCRYPDTHRTYAHKCGNCDKFGHGQIECGNGPYPQAISPHDNKIFNCTVANCRQNTSHSNDAHQPEFEAKTGVEIMFEKIQENAEKFLANKPGYFIIQGAQMGIVVIYRNNNGILESKSVDCSYDYEPEIENFVKNFKDIEIN